MKRMAPTPKVDDLAAVEARAEEAFKKAMELSMAAQSSLRLPPETPPPASSLPPVSHPMTFKDSGPDEAAIIRSRGSDEADPMKRPLSAVAVPMPGHGGHGSGRPPTYAEKARINSLNLEANDLSAKRITVEQPGGLQGKRTRRSGQWQKRLEVYGSKQNRKPVRNLLPVPRGRSRCRPYRGPPCWPSPPPLRRRWRHLQLHLTCCDHTNFLQHPGCPAFRHTHTVHRCLWRCPR